jgi:hypothetical protein
MAVKRYNGTSWDTVAGLGAQGAAATSSSITTWVKTAAGGETSLTGSSDSSTTLAYTPGQEQFFINGVLQVRGSDYTATNGTSITGLTALVAGDIATVTTVNAFSVTGAVPLSTVTANGDLIVGTSSGAVGRLGVGSTGQLLTVSGGVPTWATPAGGGGYTLLASGSLSGSSLAVTGLSSGYRDLVFIMRDFYCNSDTGLYFRVNATSSIYYSARGSYENVFVGGTSTYFEPTGSSVDSRDANNAFYWRIFDYANTSSMKMGEAFIANGHAGGTGFNFIFSNSLINTTSAVSQLNLQTDSGGVTFSGGTYEVYGVK